MTTVVTGKNQITIPAGVARELGIQRGSRVEWRVATDGRQAILTVHPSRGELARAVWGRGQRAAGGDWVEALVAERARDDAEAGR